MTGELENYIKLDRKHNHSHKLVTVKSQTGVSFLNVSKSGVQFNIFLLLFPKSTKQNI